MLMCIKRISSLSLIPAMVLLFLSVSNALGQDMMRSGDYRDGYGAYGTMGPNPNEVLAYGRAMMRYGYRKTGMPGGSSKYPGYDGHLSDATI
jgi:hypothetical protein